MSTGKDGGGGETKMGRGNERMERGSRIMKGTVNEGETKNKGDVGQCT